MMKLSLSPQKPSRPSPKAANCFLFDAASKSELMKLRSKLPAALKSRYAEKLKSYKTEKGLSVSFPTTEGGVYFIASKGSEQSQALWHRSLSSQLSGPLSSSHLKDVFVFLGTSKEDFVEDLACLGALCEWEHPKVSKKKRTKSTHSLSFRVASTLSAKQVKEAFLRGKAVGMHTNTAMDLSHTPANYLTPKLYCQQIKSFASRNAMKFNFINEKQLEKLGAHAFLSVSRGSKERDSGIAHLHFKAPNARKKVALVGKGICYDTGGYNLKPGSSMFGMHQDMTGSAIALALAGAIKSLKIPVEVDVYLALAENHVSPDAAKMNEVVMASNGMSIELIHTDAEGRMVLSDTLCIASKEKPDIMVDFATLTGSAKRAVGNERAAVFSNHSKLWGLIMKAGEESGEAVWPFPLGEEFEKSLQSKVADIKQCDEGGYADHIYAATFLNHFVDPKIKWLHMDLCPTDQKSGVGLLPKDGSGFGIRWALKMCEYLTEM